MQEANEYTACIAGWEDSLGLDATEEQLQAAAALHDRMVDAAEEVADVFNRALADYRARQP